MLNICHISDNTIDERKGEPEKHFDAPRKAA
jgi:hypothetical protein